MNRRVAGMRIPMARVDKERDSTAIAILATFHSMVESTQSRHFHPWTSVVKN